MDAEQASASASALGAYRTHVHRIRLECRLDRDVARVGTHDERICRWVEGVDVIADVVLAFERDLGLAEEDGSELIAQLSAGMHESKGLEVIV
jgi:hypothetical protein